MALNIEKKNKKSPHLALCHNELQNGAANGRNVSLLMKSDVEITPELAILIEKVSGLRVDTTNPLTAEDIEKASYETIRKQLRDAIKKFTPQRTDGYDSWEYVEDFDGENVVFYNDVGLYYATYSTSEDGVITVGDEAVPVHQVVSYRAESGDLVLSELNTLNSGVQSLIVKSFDNMKQNDKLVDVIKSIQEKGKQMEVEIQKAVSQATETLKVELEKANATIAELMKSAQDTKDQSRKETIASVVSDVEKAEELFKATQALDDSSFQVIVKSFKDVSDKLENGELFTRVSEQSDIEKSDADPLHVQMLKKQFNVQ